MEIAVLMTVFNRRETTLKCLSFLYANRVGDGKLKVYVVDDGCTDGTGEAIKEKYPEANVIKSEGNLFWNRGMHRAWTESLSSNPDYYLWLNDDTILFNDAITKMLLIAEQHSKNCIVTGSLCSPTDSHRATYGGIEKDKVVAPTGVSMECETTNGNVLLIPNKVVEKVGINNPLYHHSRGDLDYGYRVRKAGFKVLNTPTFIGTCERHDNTFKCYDPNYPILARLKFLYSPLGFRPKEVYTVSKLNGGFLNGVKMVFFTHFRSIVPGLWNLLYRIYKRM